MISAQVCIDFMKQVTYIWVFISTAKYTNFVSFFNTGVPDPIDNTTCADFHCENLVPYGNDICLEYVEDPKKFDNAYK